MRPLAFIALGFGFILMGLGLFALTLRKPKALPANPTKAQLREQADAAQETKKMRIAAAVACAFGAGIALMGLF